MWSNDFDDFATGSRRKRRKLDPKCSSTLPFKIKEPITVEDLATHSKKITEVMQWLLWAGNAPHFLLLTGPAGSAKTSTLKVVAKNLSIEIQEWVNPVDKLEYKLKDWLEPDPYDSSAYCEPKQIDKFESFAFRSSRYQTLFSSNSLRFILVEDFPNHFIWKPSVFFEFLNKYKASGHCPIVFICTDDDKLNLSCSLFPKNVRDRLNITNIKFNPVSHTGLMKGLASYANVVSKETLSDIAKASNGDIRTAISNIQFFLAAPCSSQKPKTDTLAKNISTGFYQTLGRVLYPKRRESPLDRGPKLLYDVHAIAQEYNTAFLSMLHENYPNTFASFNDVAKGCLVLSDSDLLSGDGLQEYAALTCIIGLMMANKEPKKGFNRMSPSSVRLPAKTFENSRPYPHLQMTSRTLNLDVIPYLKHFPHFAGKLMHTDAERFPTGICVRKVASIFKPPPPPPPLPLEAMDYGDDTEKMIIEEFDD